MPKVGFTPDNKNTQAGQYPRLSLKTNERARICLAENEPQMEYVHTLRKVLLDEAGKPKMKTQPGFNGKPDKQVPDTTYVGQHICLGDLEVLKNQGVDIKNCPTCEAAKKSEAVQKAKRRFALHVFRYQTQPSNFNVKEPFGAELLVWTFADGRFDELTDFSAEHGDLRSLDLLLGPCEHETFQKFNIQPGSKCAWIEDDSRKAYIKELWAEENRCHDLASLCGRKLSRELIESDVEDVLEAWNDAFNTKRSAPSVAELGTGIDVSDVLNGSIEANTPDPWAEPDKSVGINDEAMSLDLDDLLNG